MGARSERTRLGPASSVVACALALVGVLEAQEEPRVRLSGTAVAAYTAADPVPGNRSLSEVRLLQPVLSLEAETARIGFLATVNLEGATIPDGELTPGAWGEGFVDRRHPHTYVHELMVAGRDLLGGLDGGTAISVAAGKGFAPFGTDDPMMRPPLRYPVNHHLAQILERAVVIAAVRRGALLVEAGLFNGDEPESPGQWPRAGRFGDSWSARATAAPMRGAELQASHARVRSPEHRGGAGTDQVKWSLSAAWHRPLWGEPLTALVEWARTSEAEGFFVFHTILAEGAWSPGPHRLHYRFERTERPEEERVSHFRSLRPHLENAILGTTRWTVHTVGFETQALAADRLSLRPVIEVSTGTIAKAGGGLFDVDQLYGGARFWSLTLGLRVAAGAPMRRMGRYADARGGGTAAHQH